MTSTYASLGRPICLVALAALAGCATSHPRIASPAAASSPPAAPVPPLLRTAGRITARRDGFGTLRPGTRVPAREVDARAFAGPRVGFGLANLTVGETFPARTSDGGVSWRIYGPVLHVPAADGPEAVGATVVAGRSTYVAYGSSVVDVTADGGRSWWQTDLGELVLAVVAQRHRLVAVVQQQASSTGQSLRSLTWVYVSSDGGRRWRYDDRLGAS